MRPIHIIGGGVAGLALGILLRRQGVPTRVSELGHYPRHRVCGEYLSGAGQAILQELGWDPSQQTHIARTARITLTARPGPVRDLPRPAWCITRWTLDDWLARKFLELGGELHTGNRWRGPSAPGVVFASGRRLARHPASGKWMGLKSHAANIELQADLEMHSSGNSYIGLCRIPGGGTNVCALLPNRSPGLPKTAISRLCQAGGPSLEHRLKGAILQPDSFCAVAGINLHPDIRHPQAPAPAIGDALSMIPPISGNGMSMALETATMASGPLIAYAQGADWPLVTRQITRITGRALRMRFRAAYVLHTLILSRWTKGFGGRLLLNSTTLWQLGFRCTRA